MHDRFTDHGRISDLLRSAEFEENLSKKRGIMDQLSQDREFFDEWQEACYAVLAAEFRQQMEQLLSPRRFWLRGPLD